MITLRTHIAPLIAAVMLLGTPLVAQAPAPMPPTSAPPPTPVVAPPPAVQPITRTSPLPSAAAAAARASESVPVAAAQNEVPPASATMRCKDGTWLSGAPSASRCERNGGLAVILPARAPAPPPPSRAP